MRQPCASKEDSQLIRRRVLIACLPGIWCIAVAAYGQNPQTIVLPPVTLAPSETAQVNIASAAAGYPGGAFVTSCQVSITFYGADGSALGKAAEITVGSSGQIYSAKLPYATTGATSTPSVVGTRISLTPAPVAVSTLSPPIPPCAVAFSLETYDTATGVTHAFVSGQAAQGTTAPEPTVGPEPASRR